MLKFQCFLLGFDEQKYKKGGSLPQFFD
jgi:hypothetical protein